MKAWVIHPRLTRQPTELEVEKRGEHEAYVPLLDSTMLVGVHVFYHERDAMEALAEEDAAARAGAEAAARADAESAAREAGILK